MWTRQQTLLCNARTLMEDLGALLVGSLMQARFFVVLECWLSWEQCTMWTKISWVGGSVSIKYVKQGCLNGLPEKFPDVCYSWWVLSSLVIIDRAHWISKEKLSCQLVSLRCLHDQERGGISDAPDDDVDVFHMFFGVAGLSLLEYPGIRPIDPAYALPIHVVDRIFFGEKQRAAV
ncbi:unnamed protein product [Calypogeia fissa]